MKTVFMTFALFLGAAVHGQAQDWHYEVNDYGLRSITGSMQAGCLGKSLSATLRIVCQPAKRGFTGFEIALHRVDQVPQFHFDQFEGPDAPGGDMELKISTPTVSKTFHLCPNGSYGPSDANDFTFSAEDFTSSKASIPKKVLGMLAKPEAKLTVTISDPKAPSQKIILQVPENIPREQLKSLLTGIR
ncbi:MAG TPA: hypothetical protein VJ600_10520 [Holophagaceae bacterium]|nr:hypothetical protein [Holophagaceae bacterium]